MATKTMQQLRAERIRAKRAMIRQKQQQRQGELVIQTQKPPPPKPVPKQNKPKPKNVPRPQPPFKNNAKTIDVKPWLEQYNKTAYVVGGGPSLTGFDWKLLNGKFVVGINRAYEVLPEAQVIYFTDDDWWNTHKVALCNHKGIRIKGSLSPHKIGNSDLLYQFHLTGPTGLDMTPGCLKHGSNSTYAVVNMLTQWGFKTIYLLGVDMKWRTVDKGGNKGNKKTHWHSGHKRIDGESLYKRLNTNFANLAPLLKQHGVEVINVNNDSNLAAFPKKKYEEVFGPKCFQK